MPDSLTNTLETILVVDDNARIRQVVVKILSAANFKVLSADSGKAALALSLNTPDEIDMLLSDVEMPGMSGPDLGEQMKKSRPKIHVMLMSGGKWKLTGSQLRLGIFAEAVYRTGVG